MNGKYKVVMLAVDSVLAYSSKGFYDHCGVTPYPLLDHLRADVSIPYREFALLRLGNDHRFPRASLTASTALIPVNALLCEAY